MRRYECELRMTVWFDSEAESEEGITQEELESRTADAVRDGNILDCDIEEYTLMPALEQPV